MPRRTPLYDWTARVASRFPELLPAHARTLAQWSFAAALAHAANLTAVALPLAQILGQTVNAVRQRLRELYQPGSVQSGSNRSEFDPADCCGPLLRWITEGWADQRLPLALDASNLGDAFTVLAVAVVYRGVAIPVAWKVFPGQLPTGSWNAVWIGLIGRVKAALGDGWKAFVFTDRGLESAALFRALAAAGCHPMMRVKEAGRFRPKGWKTHRPMGRFAARDGARFAGRGTAYKSAKEPLECTLLACRMPGCAEPWLILTDLAPSAADAAWYGFRAWIEPLFRLTKRGGWQWQRTRMTDPDRVERVWAAMALATLWAVEVGGAAECDERAETKAEPKTRKRRRAKVERAGAKRAPERPKNRPGSEREHRVFTRGLAIILATLLNGELPVGRFVPEPWPSIKRVAPIGEAEFEARESTYP